VKSLDLAARSKILRLKKNIAAKEENAKGSVRVLSREQHVIAVAKDEASKQRTQSAASMSDIMRDSRQVFAQFYVPNS